MNWIILIGIILISVTVPLAFDGGVATPLLLFFCSFPFVEVPTSLFVEIGFGVSLLG